MRKKKSRVLEAVHDTAKGLHKAGVINQVTLREFDRLCLMPIASLAPLGDRTIGAGENQANPRRVKG
jgi:DNA-binding transcriptional regulator YiaG